MREFLEDYWIPIVVIGVVLLVILVGIYFAYQESIACTAAGGHMVTTGYVPVLQKVGSAYITNNIPIQECQVG